MVMGSSHARPPAAGPKLQPCLSDSAVPIFEMIGSDSFSQLKKQSHSLFVKRRHRCGAYACALDTRYFHRRTVRLIIQFILFAV